MVNQDLQWRLITTDPLLHGVRFKHIFNYRQN